MPAEQLTFDAQPSAVPPAGDSLLLTIPEAARLLAISRTTVYELIGAGEVEVVHIGRAVRVPRDAVVELVRRLRSVTPAS